MCENKNRIENSIKKHMTGQHIHIYVYIYVHAYLWVMILYICIIVYACVRIGIELEDL